MRANLAILFVCLGNICRSPAAEEIFGSYAKEHGIKDLKVESCGLGEWHVGNLPDRRMRRAGEQRGLLLRSRSRALRPADFQNFTHLMAADSAVEAALLERASSPKEQAKVLHLGQFSAAYPGEDIIDPYHGTADDFEMALDQLEDACWGFFKYLFSKDLKI